MAGMIVEGRSLSSDRALAPDFCVVGSGAAGGVCALKLAEAGFDVLVLEEGPNAPRRPPEPTPGEPAHVRPTFIEREFDMYRTLYQEGGARLTKNAGVKVMQGRCLGGGTTVNWSACLPPRPETLDFWRANFGLPFTKENLRPFLTEVVNYLHIHNDDRFNTSARVLIKGCTALGYSWKTLPNNTHHCRECGSCGVGCPYDRKQSGVVKWLPDAVRRGAHVYTDTRVDRLVKSGGKVTEVEATFLDAKTQRTKHKLKVRPRLGVVLAAGSVGTPAVLLRSDINPQGMVGKRTHIHPVTICIGRYAARTHPAYGVPDNMMSAQFAAGPTGYLIETGSFFPVLNAAASLDYGARLRQVMRDYYSAGAIMYAHHASGFDLSLPYGTVALDRNRDPELDYVLAEANEHAMRHSLKEMTKIHLAAGALSVYHLSNPSVEVHSTAELNKIDSISFRPQKSSVFTVHVMGGCRMAADDSKHKAVVNTDFSLRTVSNVWVADASVFPTGLGANPQVTIYALALWAARNICALHNKPFALKHQEGGTWPWNDF